MNKIFKYTIFMVFLGGIVSVLLAVVNEITLPIINENKIKKVETSLLEIDDKNKWKNITNNNDDQYIEEIYLCSDINNDKEYLYVAYLMKTIGYANGNIECIIFIDYKTNKIKKVKIITIEKQTQGIGSLILDDENYCEGFIDISVTKYLNDNIYNHHANSIDIISGATISSRGVIQALISACNNYIKFKGN